MSGFLDDSEVCDSDCDETTIHSKGAIKDNYSFAWGVPWRTFQIRIWNSSGLTNQCCSSLLNPLKMQFLTEKDLHLEKLYQVLKNHQYNVLNICSTTELLEIRLTSSEVSDIAFKIEAVLANEFYDIIVKTIPVFPHTPKLAEKLFWSNLKDGSLTLMRDDTKICIVGFASMRAIIQKTIDEIDRCSITQTVTLIEDWKPKAIKKFSLIETLSTKFKDVKCTFDEENNCVHLAGLDVTVAVVISDLEQLLSSLFVEKLSFDPLVLKLLKCNESSELLNELWDKENIIAVWTVDERGLFVFSRVKTDNNDFLKSIVYRNFLTVEFSVKDGQNNAFCKSKYVLELIKSHKNKLLVEETTAEGVNIAATKKIVQEFLNLENLWNNYNAVIQDHSSLHLKGKKIYYREFLLQLQFAQTSTKVPKDLPDLPEVTLKNPIFRYNTGISVGCVFPYHLQSVQLNRNRAHSKGGNLPKRNSQGGHNKISDRPSAEKVINLSSMQQEVKLHKAESAWKPSHKENRETKTAEDLKTEELFKKVRSILNKATQQTFQTLVKQMSDLEISSEEHLKGVAYLVFEKAIVEPLFSVAYASMCRYLTQINVPSTSKPGEVLNFHAILVTRCQNEFEKVKDDKDKIEKLWVTMMEETHEDRIAALKEKIELAETNTRLRYLGNIRFIGELFNLNMLAESIVHECVFKLLNNKDEESLRCLCQLLRTIGKKIDTDNAKPRINQYFQRMTKLVQEKKTSFTIRFMMQDIIDLRSSNWVPEKTQIHKKDQQEEQEKMLMLQTVSVKSRSGRGSGRGGGGPRLSGSMGGAGAPDGWNTTGSRGPSMRGERQTIDPSRLKGTMKSVFTETHESQTSTLAFRMPIDRIQAHLHDLVVDKPVRNEEILDWIEANLDDVTTKDRKFIRALMTAVCSSAITGRGNRAKVDPTRINQRGVILRKYLDNQAEFELQALYALQALVHKLEHPPGVLQTLFDTLYDEDIISDNAFNQWEVSKDPAEQKGKGAAMKKVAQFFTWLRETDDETES